MHTQRIIEGLVRVRSLKGLGGGGAEMTRTQSQSCIMLSWWPRIASLQLAPRVPTNKHLDLTHLSPWSFCCGPSRTRLEAEGQGWIVSFPPISLPILELSGQGVVTAPHHSPGDLICFPEPAPPLKIVPRQGATVSHQNFDSLIGEGGRRDLSKQRKKHTRGLKVNIPNF